MTKPTLDGLVAAHKQSMPWLADSITMVARSGSHAYGTSLPTSDLDFKGFAIPPIEYFHGFVKKFEQAEQHEPFDAVIYDIRKFFTLAADCNPSIIETLFVDDSDIIHITYDGEYIRKHANSFLSKKVKHTFSGYAFSQLGRIKRHYEWLHNPPKKEPTREDFGLPERTTIPGDQRAAIMAAVKKRVDEWNGLLDLDMVDSVSAMAMRHKVEQYLASIHMGEDKVWESAAKDVGVPPNVMEVLLSERAYNGARNVWQQYLTWQKQRNPARAALEAKYGYDTKHGMHLVRLMRMGHEILTTGKVNVKRPDAQELLEIRGGSWTYEEILEWAERMDVTMQKAYDESKLPHSPDRDFLDRLCRISVASALEGTC